MLKLSKVDTLWGATQARFTLLPVGRIATRESMPRSPIPAKNKTVK